MYLWLVFTYIFSKLGYALGKKLGWKLLAALILAYFVTVDYKEGIINTIIYFFSAFIVWIFVLIILGWIYKLFKTDSMQAKISSLKKRIKHNIQVKKPKVSVSDYYRMKDVAKKKEKTQQQIAEYYSKKSEYEDIREEMRKKKIKETEDEIYQNFKKYGVWKRTEDLLPEDLNESYD